MLPQRTAEPRAGQSEAKAGPATPELASRLDDLSTRLDQTKADFERATKAAAPADLEPINKRIASLEGLPRKVEALEARLGSLPPKLDEENRKVTTLMADVAGMRDQVTSLRTELSTKALGKPGSAATEKATQSSEPPREFTPPLSGSLGSSMELFQQKKYKEASESFERLTAERPDDARVWYYAALARGLATRDWKGQTETLVTEGVKREKAGAPARAEIDAAFSDLTPESGKDWLAFYRRRAQ
jgi:hypothetical protein